MSIDLIISHFNHKINSLFDKDTFIPIEDPGRSSDIYAEILSALGLEDTPENRHMMWIHMNNHVGSDGDDYPVCCEKLRLFIDYSYI